MIESRLVAAIERGVKVEIITARRRDQMCYKYFLNSDLFKYLMSKGAEVLEEDYKFLHMKAYFVDGKRLSIGSMNNDQWSFFCNN